MRLPCSSWLAKKLCQITGCSDRFSVPHSEPRPQSLVLNGGPSGQCALDLPAEKVFVAIVNHGKLQYGKLVNYNGKPW